MEKTIKNFVIAIYIGEKTEYWCSDHIGSSVFLIENAEWFSSEREAAEKLNSFIKPFAKKCGWADVSLKVVEV